MHLSEDNGQTETRSGEQVSCSEGHMEHLSRVFIMQYSRLWTCISQHPCPRGACSLEEEEEDVQTVKCIKG